MTHTDGMLQARELVEFVSGCGMSQAVFGVEHEDRVYEVSVTLRACDKPADGQLIKPTRGFYCAVNQ